MNFAQSDSQRMIADTVSRLFTSQNSFDDRRRRLAGPSPDRLALWSPLAELGVIGTLFPESLGGFGGTARDAAIVLYEIGRSLAVEPFLATLGASRLLLAAATLDSAIIDSIIAGERIIVPAYAESVDPFAVPGVTASRRGAAYELSGVKPIVRNADVAHGFIVTARLEENGLPACFLVDREVAGLDLEPHRLIDASGAATVRFDRVDGVLLLAGEAAQAAILDAVEWSIVGAAAEAAGILDMLNSMTREYLRTRVQFGVPIGSFQALQHRAANMYIAAEEALVMADTALTALDAGPSTQRSAEISALKMTLDRAGRLVSHEAVQLHGGMGVSDELIISHYLRRLAAIRAEFGNAAIHRERFLALQG